MDSLTTKAQVVFAKDLYATQSTHVEVASLQHDPEHRGGRAVCTMEICPEHLNARGAVMGGALFTLADLAFAAASNVEQIESEQPLAWVSLDSNIRYLSPATQGRLKAEAECVKHGRNTCNYRIVVKDEKERIIATVDTMGMRV